MRSRFRLRLAAAFAVVLASESCGLAQSSPQAAAVAAPQTGQPDVATLLFSTPQWGRAPVGSAITYDYSKKVADAASFGAPFDDHVVLKLDPGDAADARTSEVRMFSGPNAKPAGPFHSDQQNPVLLLVLEENVQELSKAFKANPRYLKNAIRKAWRDHAKIEPAQIDVNGKTVAGTRITVQPFVGDPQAEKMKGLDGMVYTVEIADSVPGNIAAIDIHAPPDGGSKFSETLHYGTSKTP